MGALSKMKQGLRRADFSLGPLMGHGIVGEAAETVIGGGTSYVLGQVHGRYRDTEYIEHLPAALGVVGKVAALAFSAVSGGHHRLAGVCDAVGQAGVNAHFLSLGIEHGMKASGKKLLILPKGAEMPKGLPSSATSRDTVLGEIPPPAAGRYLNRDGIRDLARHV